MSHQVLHQLVIHGYEVTVGWANQPSGPLPRDIGVAVSSGATRNVYIGIKTANSSALDSSEKVTKFHYHQKRIAGRFWQVWSWNKSISFTIGKWVYEFLRIADAIKVVSILNMVLPLV